MDVCILPSLQELDTYIIKRTLMLLFISFYQWFEIIFENNLLKQEVYFLPNEMRERRKFFLQVSFRK